MPDIAIRPRTADEISRIMGHLFSEGIPVFAAGRNRPGVAAPWHIRVGGHFDR